MLHVRAGARRTGQPYHNAIVWNDNRTTDIAERLARVGGKDRLRPKTGLPLAPYFSATKLIWLLDHVEGLREDAERCVLSPCVTWRMCVPVCDRPCLVECARSGEALFGTIDTWLLYKLTNGRLHVTDVTNASRTLMMSLYTLDWDDELLKILNIPRAMLPEIRSSSEVYGETDAVAPGIPIAGILGDQQAALFGQHCLNVGEAKATYGTGAFMLLNTGNRIIRSDNGLLTTVAYKLGPSAEPVYALEGSVAQCGYVIQWLRDNLQVIAKSKESETLATSVANNGGVYFVPAFNGLFTPYWRNDARGVIVGLTAYNTKAHLCRAALESAAFQVKEVLDAAYNDSAVTLRSLKVDGGMTVNSLLMQFQADLLNVPVIRPYIIETTALGAAFVAGLAVQYWSSPSHLKELWKKDKEWKPVMDDQARVTLLRSWRKAIRRSLNWTDTEEVEVRFASTSLLTR